MDATALSPRARAWLATLEVTRKTPAEDATTLGATLREHGATAWPVLVDVETRFGGLAGELDDVRDLWLGPGQAAAQAESGAPLVRKLEGRPHVLVGAFAPAFWYMDERGRVLELDDLGQVLQASDSLEKRLEQLAVEYWLEAVLPESAMERLDGARGDALAGALELTLIAEASDARERWWTSPALLTSLDVPDGLVVLESVEPSDYGEDDLVTRTYVYAASEESLDAALARLPKTGAK